MKRHLQLLTSLVILAGGMASGTASATIKDLCQSVVIAGRYQTNPDMTGIRHFVDIAQNGCSVVATEHWTNDVKRAKQHNWRLDLGGDSDFGVPGSILKENRDSELGYRSLSSLKGTAVLSQIGIGSPDDYAQQFRVGITIKMTVPESQNNQIESVVEVKGSARFFAFPAEKQQEPRKVSYIQFETESVRLIAVNSYFVGPLKDFFMRGANYVLGYLDNANYIGVFAPQLQTLQRVN